MSALLEVEGLSTGFGRTSNTISVVRSVSFTMQRGETVGLVGESGSGKSITALSVMGLLPRGARITAGDILLNGQSLPALPEKDWQQIRGKRIAMVFQDPFSSLNPTLTLGEQVAEALRLHQGMNRRQAQERTQELFRQVNLPNPELKMRQYPHQASGGQRQRVLTAMAFACDPELLIADEPTTALDVTVQAQVLQLLLQMQQRINTAILLITHDLGVVAAVCSRILVMYAGQIVESGPVREVLTHPQHPYTQALLASLPPRLPGPERKLSSLPGQPPAPGKLPAGCAFAPRCPLAQQTPCRQVEPELTQHGSERQVRCHFAAAPQAIFHKPKA